MFHVYIDSLPLLGSIGNSIYLFIYTLFKVGNRIQQQVLKYKIKYTLNMRTIIKLKKTMLAVSQRDTLIYTNYI